MTHRREGSQRLSGRILGGFVLGREPELSQVLGDAADRRSIAAPIVVEDDHHLRLELADVVERLVGHAPRECPITDDTHHLALLAAQPPSRGDAERIAQAGRRVRVLDHVVLRLAARWIPGEPALLAERFEEVQPAGDHLVHVCLMTGVEDDRVAGAVEDSVQCHGELDDTEVRAQVTARA